MDVVRGGVIRDLTCGDPAGSAQIANSRSGNTRITACKLGIVQMSSDVRAGVSNEMRLLFGPEQTVDTCGTRISTT